MTANETGCFSAKVRTIAIQPLIRAMLVFADRALFFPLLFVGIMPFKVWVPALDLISILENNDVACMIISAALLS